MKPFDWMSTLALGATALSLTLGCGGEQKQAQAAPAQGTGERVGAETGEAADAAGEDITEATEDTAEALGLEGRHRYECASGEEFSVEFKNDGRAALVEMDNRQYWLDLEPGTGRFSSQQGRLWTIGEDMASLELEGKPPLRNCERQ